MSKIADVFVAGFPRTGRAPRRLRRRRPMLFVSPRFVPEPCVLFLYPGAVSGDCSRQPRVRPNTAHGVESAPLAAPHRAQFSCLCFSDFSCPRTSYLIIVEEISLLLMALLGAGHGDVRVVPYFVHPDSRRGVLVYMPAPRCKHGAGGGDSGRCDSDRNRLLTRPLLGCLCV